jgi:hypothetical protein
MVLNLSRLTRADDPFNLALNNLIERAEPPSKNSRQYLGASSIGSDCLRKIQFDWFCDPEFPVRTKDIFERGHSQEARTRQHLIDAGFKFAPDDQLKFEAADGLFRGHADGKLIAGPDLPGLFYPALWEHKCVKAKGWKDIARDGLTGLYRIYSAQIAVYQVYLDVTNPALFSVVNADTCERLHFLVPFDVQLAQATSDRAVTIIEATRAGEALPRISEDPNDWRCKLCSHRTHCWSQP